MLFINCATSTTLTLFLLTINSSAASLFPRSRVCANDGTTKAGTLYTRRSFSVSEPLSAFPLPSLPDTLPPTRRTITSRPPLPCIWCALNTQTYIIVVGYAAAPLVNQYYDPIGESGTVWAVSQTISQVHSAMTAHGADGVIPVAGNNFGIDAGSMGLIWANANNHQLTYGVLQNALEALRSWMIFFNACGIIHYDIFDGGNRVGTGSCSWM